MTLPEVQNAISEKKICVLIPTYNNEKTLKRVIDGVLDYTENIIVINDGSTDSTLQILEKYSITIINLSENKGKGNALKIGFRKAKESGYNYAITIDSDGQHYPDDIPVFVENLLQENEDVLLIGNRNMSQDGIPKKAVLEIVSLISGFGLRPGSSLKTHNPVIVFTLYIKFRKNILLQNLNLRSKLL